ncbi:16S rRNA (guanine(527)-N(7))-methyltransferase RsmG [Falsiroseomonas sp.]|uniref:16S rRNA (guanine(527)-N(7))-methyltransferase RsmG n=1 Tax=Falsiroseomonas sp. TaxID=2870721 RepID=UPI002735EB7B|nr:16S rRNA (guanine(527)-N(7))-methyltransferase RsmG [Falsiroseomonas sp.]MDP3417554.1 16S rRNA (guanine(527)-N(7))-methyltransferase RsmG [Falsiroseomonas sp.]
MKHPADSPPQPLPAPTPLDDSIRARLDAYVELLLRWNARINLVGRTTTDQVWDRHVEDSLQLVPLLPPGTDAICDLGSGAGLPGLVLAIATGRPAHLVESDRRKAAFLTEAAARLDLPQVQIHATRIEDARLPPIAILTARALAPLGTLLAYAERLLAPGGVALFPKGRMAEAELAEARTAWSFTLDRFASRTDPEATILRLSDIRHVQPQA